MMSQLPSSSAETKSTASSSGGDIELTSQGGLQALPLSELRSRWSAKWKDFSDEILPMPVAEMDFPVAGAIRAELAKMVAGSDLGYLSSIPELAPAFAGFAKRRWNWEVDQSQIRVCPDVGVGMVEMTRAVIKPGGKILINSPVYHNFFNWASELKVQVVDVPLTRLLIPGEITGWQYSMDFEAIEAAYISGIEIHYLCNPANPVGTVFTRDELSRLADLAKKYNVLIFSDEIHGPLTFSEIPFTPFLTVSETARQVGIVVTAASKSWNIAGLKCALVITQDDKLKAALDLAPAAMQWRAGLLGAVAASIAFSCDDWLDAALITLDENRRFLVEELAKKLPGVKYRVPDCSYLAWLDVTDLNLGDDPAAVFLEKGRVAFNSGRSFSPNHNDHNQFVRLNFGCDKSVIVDAIDRMVAATK